MFRLLVFTSCSLFACTPAPPPSPAPSSVLREITLTSALDPVDLISPDVTFQVRFTRGIPDYTVTLSHGEASVPLQEDAHDDVVTATPSAALEAGAYTIAVAVNGNQVRARSFDVTLPCHWLADDIQVGLRQRAGATVHARADWPLVTYTADVTDPALVVSVQREDGTWENLPGDETLTGGRSIFSADTLIQPSHAYRASFSYACSGAPAPPVTLTRDATADCAALASDMTVSVAATDSGTVTAAATWPAETASIYGQPDSALLTLSERPSWCTPPCPASQETTAAATTVTDPESPAMATDPVAGQLNHIYTARALLRCPTANQGSRISEPVEVYSGGTLTDGALLVGRTFSARGDDFVLFEPTGPGTSSLESVLHMRWLPNLSIDDVDLSTGAVHSRMSWSNQIAQTPAQKPCAATDALPVGTMTDGVLAIGPTDLAVGTGMGIANLYDFEMTAAANADATRLDDIVFSGYFDMRDLSVELGYATGQDFCQDSARYGIQCEPCPGHTPDPVCVYTSIGAVTGLVAPDLAPEDLICPALGQEVRYLLDIDRIVTTTYGEDTVRGLNLAGDVVWTYRPQYYGPVQEIWIDRAERRPRVVIGMGQTYGQYSTSTVQVIDARDGRYSTTVQVPSDQLPSRNPLSDISLDDVVRACSGNMSTTGLPVSPGLALAGLLGFAGMRRSRRRR